MLLLILMSLSQTGWNHVYKFLFLVTYMGPSSSSRFVHCITSWFTLLHHPVKSLVQHLTSYPSKYTHCLLFVILINIRPSIFISFWAWIVHTTIKNANLLHFLCLQAALSYKFHVQIFLTKTVHSRNSTQYFYILSIPRVLSFLPKE